ncbi:hypothetical protein B0J12DRAFT_181225 [Macrophomina phaseolina]|uniref:Uncharacterized protein n=1 Tax=Macrophomina phaseolina TaxID=35725 RepID=A0ABQ8G7A3_9PEZI|nr:hypothetical protein B0J12DRAFT_181225 [Macrophomina phaseolina]
MLCAMCLSIFRPVNQRQTWGQRTDHHASLEHVESAARSGCKICLGLQQYISSSTMQGGGPITLKFDYVINKFWTHKEIILLHLFLTPGYDHQVPFQIVPLSYVDPLSGSDNLLSLATMDLSMEPWRVRPCGTLQSLPRSTGHRKVAAQASDWLHECVTAHPDCESGDPKRNPKWYPKSLHKANTQR